jgi:hypothetical protein
MGYVVGSGVRRSADGEYRIDIIFVLPGIGEKYSGEWVYVFLYRRGIDISGWSLHSGKVFSG